MHRVYIVEGMPCAGKSTASRFAAKVLEEKYKVCYYDEGSGNHPADYEFNSFLNQKDLSLFTPDEQRLICEKSERKANGLIVPLCEFSGELFDKLLEYKIYDYLPWEKEMPVMLEKWRDFAVNADKDTVYVFNCVLLQNPMCETMMRFGFDEKTSFEYISSIVSCIKEMEPFVIYLKNDSIAEQVMRTAEERDGWLDAVIKYHVDGGYGKSINAEGFDGYIKCLEHRQERELEILKKLNVQSAVIENAHNGWAAAYEKIRGVL
ncbi:MAG: hypothetical protein IJZ72_03680 [Oscillospiraceae bacterium]|nr:hypothetical protein [Oscillospiraceae bacterium]